MNNPDQTTETRPAATDMAATPEGAAPDAPATDDAADAEAAAADAKAATADAEAAATYAATADAEAAATDAATADTEAAATDAASADAEAAATDTAPASVPTRERSYIAFISYRHLPLDKEAAERVQKKIESYTIPKEFREEFGGKKFGHAFRDEDELPTSASLTDSIYYALDHSKFLVVICTPGLPQSKWCEAEIRYFLKTHDRDHVLAVLADGRPEESFSPYLLHEFDEDGNVISDFEPLAANIAGPNHTINKKALNKEMVRLYASFIGCPFDSLWQREKRARTNRLLSIAGLAIAILCVFLGVVLNRNARIEEQNVQIAAQNDQLTIQNEKIEEQNKELQSRLSSVFVDSGIAKLGGHDIKGALKDAVSSLESGDPDIYDHRVGKLMSDALCTYSNGTLRSSIVYEQSTGIRRISLAQDKAHLLVLDDVGVLRCLDLETYDVLWDQPTNNKNTELYADLPGGNVICKSTDGVFCYSLTDGSPVWSFPQGDLSGNNFQAVSEDGTLFAVIDSSGAGGTPQLVFLRTEDGSESGRVDLEDDGNFTPSITFIDEYYAYPAAFSADNSRFAFGIPGKDAESGDECDRFYLVNMETLSKESIGVTGSKYRMFYGIDVDSEDDSVFFAAYTLNSIYTVLCTKGADGYEFIEHRETHSYSSPGGVLQLTGYFDSGDCRFLSNRGRIYIFSDDQMFIFGRADNALHHNYSMTGAVINAYWIDKENGVMEIVTDDAYIVDYYMEYSEDSVLSGVVGDKADQTLMTRICPAGNTSIANGGTYYNISSEAPGRLYFVGFENDPNAETFHPSTADSDFSDFYEFLISDASDLGYLFYDQKSAATFDKRTGKIVRSATFDDYLTANQITIIDNEHFMSGQTLYGMDGTAVKYGEKIDVNLTGGYPFYHTMLTDGRILSYDKTPLFGYQRADAPDSGLNVFETLYLCAVWLDGKPVKSLCDPNSGVLFLEDTSSNAPAVSAGSNGLFLVCGRIAELKDADAKSYTVHDAKEMCFIDAVTGKVSFIADILPESGNFKPAFAHEKGLCAVSYDDGTVCIYDADGKAADGAAGAASTGATAGGPAAGDADGPAAGDADGTAAGDADGPAAGDADGTAAGDADGPAAGDAGAASAAACIPVHKYNADEVSNLCFSDDDAYLLVLTFAGQLDVYEVGGTIGGSAAGTAGGETEAVPVYSEKIDVFRENSALLSSRVLTAKTAGNSDLLFVSVYNSCLVLEKGYWTEISEFEGTNSVYDPGTDRVYFMINNYSDSVHESSDIISYPVYDIGKLKEWAEAESK